MTLTAYCLRCGSCWTGLGVYASEQSSQRLEKSTRKTKHGDMLSIYGASSGRLNFDNLASEYEWGGLDFSQPLPPPLHTPLPSHSSHRESSSLVTKGHSSTTSTSASLRTSGAEEGWGDQLSVEGAAPKAVSSKSGKSSGGHGRKQNGGSLSVREKLSPLRGDAAAEPWMDGFAAPEREERVAQTRSGMARQVEGSLVSASRPLPPLQALPRGRVRTVEEGRVRERAVPSLSPSSPPQSLSPRRPNRRQGDGLEDGVGDDVAEPNSGAALRETPEVGNVFHEGSASGWKSFGGKPSQLWEEQAYKIIERQKRRELERLQKGLAVGEERSWSTMQRSDEASSSSSGTRESTKKGARDASRKRLQGSSVAKSSVSPRRSLERARSSLAADVAADVAVLKGKNQNPLLVEYLGGLGMGPEELAKVAERNRSVLQLSVQVAKDRVGRLQALGVKTGDLCRLLLRHPQVLEYAPERYDTLVKFLRGLEVPAADVGKVVTLAPALLAYSLDAVEERVRFLRSELGTSRKDLPKIIVRSPQILTQSVEDSLRPRARYLREEVGVSREALARMVLRHPQLLHYSLEEGLRPRIKFLESIGIKGDDVAAVISRFSQVLSLSVEKNLHPKYSYLVKWLGGGPKTVTSYPAYFSLSLLERIRPRHLYLVAKQRMPYGPFPMKHLAITDREFVQQVAKSDIEDYLVFRNRLLDHGEKDLGLDELEKLVK